MITPIAKLDGELRISAVDCYHASGPATVIWAVIEGFHGKKAMVCIDTREESPTRHRLFDQARHPSAESAQLVELGDPEEGVVISLLSRWCDDSRNWVSNGGQWWDDFGKQVKLALLQIGSSN